MRVHCNVLSLNYVSLIEGEMQANKYFGAKVKCRSSLTDFNQTYIVCSECTLKVSCHVREFVEMKFEVKTKRYLVF
jgi:hypothetical protein